jgi:serine/threonine-protein kinase
MEKLCVIKSTLAGGAENAARFSDEAALAVKLSHGNIVQVFDTGIAAGRYGDELYIAMEYVDGKDLRAIWNRCAKRGICFPVDVAAFLVRELCRGLHHAHTVPSLDIVHRDVSPPNVLVSFCGQVKLSDFGLADTKRRRFKTRGAAVMGKPSYMSPEQARGLRLDARSDVFSAGVILWEMLTGRQLFPPSVPDLMKLVRAPTVIPPTQLAPRVTPVLETIVMRALVTERRLRYTDCEAFRAALSGYLASYAPTTDTERVAGFLGQLFGDEIAEGRRERQGLLERAAKQRAERAEAQRVETTPPRPALPPIFETGRAWKDPVGTCLNERYRVKRQIGVGGIGVVFEAEHVELGRRVAVKVLHASRCEHSEALERFRIEARAASRIRHPNIVDVFDFGTTRDGQIYLAMEYLEGRDLAQLLSDVKQLPLPRALSIAHQVCDALAAAHEAGILHRDLKPDNIFLVNRDGADDFVKVLDFGVAKIADSAMEVTKRGQAVGTPEYMAPEQASGQRVDARSDVYAFGVILYEMLAGQLPHDGDTVLEVFHARTAGPPPPLSHLRSEVPAALSRLVMRALAQSPRRRPKSMKAMAAELSWAASLTREANRSLAPQGSAVHLSRARARNAIAALGIAALAGGIGWFAGRATGRTVVEPSAASPPSSPLEPTTPKKSSRDNDRDDDDDDDGLPRPSGRSQQDSPPTHIRAKKKLRSGSSDTTAPT